MFDGIRIEFYDVHFPSRLSLDLKDTILDQVNSGVIQKSTFRHKGLNVTIYPSGRVVIIGSLHKFYNDGIHNYNDFTHSILKTTINNLMNELGINPELAVVSNLEFGVNIITPFNPDNFLNHLIRFKNTAFSIMKVDGKGNGRTCTFDQYEIKIYNKGLQYQLDYPLLRFEKKIRKMCALNYDKKIYLKDLLCQSLWIHCKNELLNIVPNILLNESLSLIFLSKVEQRVYNSVIDQSKWLAYCKTKRARCKASHNKVIAKYGTEKYSPTLLTLITLKCEELMK